MLLVLMHALHNIICRRDRSDGRIYLSHITISGCDPKTGPFGPLLIFANSNLEGNNWSFNLNAQRNGK